MNHLLQKTNISGYYYYPEKNYMVSTYKCDNCGNPEITIAGEQYYIRLYSRDLNCRLNEFSTFDYAGAIDINLARSQHLISLQLGDRIENKKVLGVGCGVRDELLRPFQNANCEIIITDARKDNVDEFMRRYPNYQSATFVANVMDSKDLTWLGRFDIVFCYGLLYHLSDPMLAIQNMHNVCDDLLIIETIVDATDNGYSNLVQEDHTNPNQSIEGVGCRPSRDYLFDLLKQIFPFAYYVNLQPNNAEFPEQWPVVDQSRNARCVFVASKNPIKHPYLVENKPNQYKKLKIGI